MAQFELSRDEAEALRQIVEFWRDAIDDPDINGRAWGVENATKLLAKISALQFDLRDCLKCGPRAGHLLEAYACETRIC